MENIEKYTDFFHTSFSQRSENSKWVSKMSELTINKIKNVAQWWHPCSGELVTKLGLGIGHYVFTYINSCQYTDHAVEIKMKEMSSENQELKSLIYGMLDEINELKEHNKSLSERILSLENKPPVILY